MTITIPSGKLAAVEEWRAVVGWEGYYEVSSEGRVRRVRGGRGTRVRFNGGVLRPTPGSHGYLAVALSRDGRCNKFLVHHLVTEAFLGPRLLTVDHRDGDPLNNRVSNLRYLTQADNNRAAGARHGHVTNRRRLAKLNEHQVLEIRRRVALGETQAALRREFKICCAQMSRIVNRQRWAHLPEWSVAP